jgi:hypothetical protein
MILIVLGFAVPGKLQNIFYTVCLPAAVAAIYKKS